MFVFPPHVRPFGPFLTAPTSQTWLQDFYVRSEANEVGIGRERDCSIKPRSFADITL